MRSQQDTSNSDSDLDNDSSQPSHDVSDIAYAAAVTGNIVRAEKIRKKYPDTSHSTSTLQSIGKGIHIHGGQPHYLEKIQILTLLQHEHTTHEIIDQRIEWIQRKERNRDEKWFMTKVTNQTVNKAHNALSLKKFTLPITTDEACQLVHSGNWGALVLLASLVKNGHIRKNLNKSDFLPLVTWVRILEFTLGINNRELVKPQTYQQIWEYSLMVHAGNFLRDVMRPIPIQNTGNETAPCLPFRRGRYHY